MAERVTSIFADRRFDGESRGVVWIASGRADPTNELLIGALHERGVQAELVQPTNLADVARESDTVVGRLDVRPTLDGVEAGLSELRRVEGRGTRVLNPAPSLLACHDKLQTAIRLARLGLRHPSTQLIDETATPNGFAFPLVVKPRFGSWGQDVVLCRSERELRRWLRQLRKRTWFQQQGALVQEVVPPRGFDLRLVVAGGEIVGAIRRIAASGEWRTNIALGGSREPVAPTPLACDLARAAAAAVGGHLVGVDLLPLAQGGYVVIEVNGAVEFTADYSLGSEDVFEAVARRIALQHAELRSGA